MRQDTREIDADIHEAHDHRTDEHGAVQAFRILVTDTTHDRLWQRNRTDAHEDPLREIESDRHMAGRKRFQHLRMLHMDILHDSRIAATCG